jgi:hypothetical protein
MLAVTGASPVVATEQTADAQATWKACLGPALVSRDFSDVGMDSVHYDDINCLAYYGITTGMTADTYDPGGHVTRWQMALFLTRAAKAAGIDLGDAMDMGFTDLGTAGADGVMAINTLASNGIMPGRTATAFDPQDLVTRADMALHLFRLLDLALDSVLIDMLPDSAEGNTDGVGKIEHSDFDGDGIGIRVDDYFGDVRRTLPAHMDDIIGAVYELGVTNGVNGMVGENGIFNPQGNVTRAQMASFIMRAMNHTNLRPEGLTAQQTAGGSSGETQVSVRDADFAPISEQRVEVMSSSYADDAFDRSGRCIGRFTSTFHPSFEGFGKCEIDLGDPQTDADGNVTMAPGSSSGPTFACSAPGAAPRVAPNGRGVTSVGTYTVETAGVTDLEANYRVWAWTGDLGDEIGTSTELFEVGASNAQSGRRSAVAAVFSGGTAYEVRMGHTLTYKIQLVDVNGMPVGPNPGADHSYTVRTVTATGGSATTDLSARPTFTETGDMSGLSGGTVLSNVPETRVPDSNGLIEITVRVPDPRPGPANDDASRHVAVRVVNSARNTLPLVDLTNNGGVLDRTPTTGDTTPYQIGIDASGEVFSDDDPVATSLRAVSTAGWRMFVPGGTNRNSIQVTVLDQYGNRFTGAGLEATITPAGRTAVTATVSRGIATLSYTGPASAGADEVGSIGAGTLAATAVTVQWASRGLVAARSATPGTGNVLVIDAASREVVVTGPVAYQFGDDDSFLVGSVTDDGGKAALTRAQFQEVLLIAADTTDPRIQTRDETELIWAGYNFNRPNDGAAWELTGLECRRLRYG